MATKAIVGIVCAIGLSGCGDFAPPKSACDQETTKSAIRQIFQQDIESRMDDPRITVESNDIMEGVTVSLESVRADSFRRKTNTYACKADLHVTLPDSAVSKYAGEQTFKTLLANTGVIATSDGLRAPVVYTWQSADNGQIQHVVIRGQDPLVQSVIAFAIKGAFDFAPAGGALP
jgi:hypothetical protein